MSTKNEICNKDLVNGPTNEKLKIVLKKYVFYLPHLQIPVVWQGENIDVLAIEIKHAVNKLFSCLWIEIELACDVG